MADFMKAMECAKEMTANEIEKLYRKGDLTETGLKALDDLVDIAKDATIIIAMEEEKYNGYSERYPMYGYGYDDYAMARKRDSRGRYTRADGYMHDDRHEMIEHFQRKMNEARDDREREMYRNAIRDLEAR